MHVERHAIGVVGVDRADTAQQFALAVSTLSVTIAPCRSSMMPSQPPFADASQMIPAMCSKAASSTGRLGGAPAAIGRTISAPSRSARSR